MEKLFLNLLNVSISSCWLILAVLILRLVFKKAPRGIICALWSVVGLRLLLPFKLESPVSLLPSAEVLPETFFYSTMPHIDTGVRAIDNIFNPLIADALASDTGANAQLQIQDFFNYPTVCIAGTVVLLIYMLASFLLVKRKVREAALVSENIWACDNIVTPFIFGVICPKIYVPSDMTEEDGVYVLSHEKMHIKRLDHIWKPIGFLVLALHWFNPMVWLAYFIFCRDIEFACDESVIRHIGADKKKEYSTALLNLSTPKHMITACALAFGETNIRARIKGVLNYKNPTLWLTVTAVMLAIASVAVFFAGPIQKTPISKDLGSFINAQIWEQNIGDYIPAFYQIYDYQNAYRISDFEVLDRTEENGEITVYIWFYYGEYVCNKKTGNITCTNFSHGPVAITAQKSNGSYELIEYKEADPLRYTDYMNTAKEFSPPHLHGKKESDFSRYNYRNAAKNFFPPHLHGKLDYFLKYAPAIAKKDIRDMFWHKATKYFNS